MRRQFDFVLFGRVKSYMSANGQTTPRDHTPVNYVYNYAVRCLWAHSWRQDNH